ncbi:MAG: hypothetical protein QXJ06_02300 [Candidatus Aenigmatarchaeota archaeon]
MNNEITSLNEIKTFGSTLGTWKNMLIFGDNYLALKSLLKNSEIKNKIKLIYIDPPFSTNKEFRSGISKISTITSSSNDEIAYKDKLNGKEYLNFMKKKINPS